jgi:hypothetical protein
MLLACKLRPNYAAGRMSGRLEQPRPGRRRASSLEDQNPDRRLTLLPVDEGAPCVLDQSGRRTGRAMRRIVYPVAP